MKNHDWIDAKTAQALLGIKPQTLYAYVSRHKIRVQADPADARASLYSRTDLETLLRQKKRPRARADVAKAAIRWGEPVMVTSISEVREGTLWLRGQRIEDCTGSMTLEEVAALLCGVEVVNATPVNTPTRGKTAFSRAMLALAHAAETSPPIVDLPDTSVEVGRMMARVTNACLGVHQSGPLHMRAVQAWNVPPPQQDMIRQALVLLSDHELNPSTFAVRVCASTGTNLPSALLAGMATLSGPRHGAVAERAMQAMAAQREGCLDAFLAAHPDPYGYGFGHPLYPEGDPRAAHLLSLLPEGAAEVAAMEQIAQRLGQPPNIDAALVAMTSHLNCTPGAAGALFAIGRTAGWCAHAIEQASSGDIIRPRARFQKSCEQSGTPR